MVLSFSEAGAQAVQGAACTLLAFSDEATKWINQAYGMDADLGNIAGALRKRVCNESSPDTSDVGPSDPGIPGGQCPGVEYTIEITASATSPYTDETYTFTTSATIDGPITSYDLFVNNRATICTAPGGVSGRKNTRELEGRFRVFNDVGSELSNLAPEWDGDWGSDDCLPVDGYVNPTDVVSADSVTITRTDGLPDDCGSIPGVVGDYNNYSTTTSITYEDNTETTITEDIDITIGPLIVGIGGVVYAPVTVTTGPIDIEGRLVLAPEVRVDLFPDGGGGGGTSDPIPDPGEEDPSPTPEERRDRIIGVVVTTTGYDENLFQGTYAAQGATPDLFLPRLGNVSFFIETSQGQAWTDPTPVKTIRSYIPCPAREGAVDVAFTPETGVTADVAPVYAELSTAL